MLVKYPRTRHLEGSNRQPGDEDLEGVPISALAGQWLIVEEKIDGANCAISFDAAGTIQVQSRGHYLTGGWGERHFDLLKSFANGLQGTLREVLGNRFILYGEWLYAKHTVFYDMLPSYFLEFDVFDREEVVFLSTCRRVALLTPLRPAIVSVPILGSGKFRRAEELTALVGPSAFIHPDLSTRLEHFQEACERAPARPGIEVGQTDLSGLAEGLYVKSETADTVSARYKWVRHDFLQRILDSGSHWQTRPMVRNRLAETAP